MSNALGTKNSQILHIYERVVTLEKAPPPEIYYHTACCEMESDKKNKVLPPPPPWHTDVLYLPIENGPSLDHIATPGLFLQPLPLFSSDRVQ